MSKKKQEVKEVKRFVVSKGMIGKGLRIRFTSAAKGKTWEYDHDAVYEAAKEKLEAMNCWHRYKNYTSTTNVPSFAKELAEEV